MPGWCDYQFMHENILYGWAESGWLYFIHDRTQGSVFEIDKPHSSELHPTSSTLPFDWGVDSRPRHTVDSVPPQRRPGPTSRKTLHNGYAKSLKQLVHFYNARRVSVPRHFRKLPDGNDGKGGLLADARGSEQYRHDSRKARLVGFEEDQIFLQTLTDGNSIPTSIPLLVHA